MNTLTTLNAKHTNLTISVQAFIKNGAITEAEYLTYDEALFDAYDQACSIAWSDEPDAEQLAMELASMEMYINRVYNLIGTNICNALGLEIR